MKKKTIKPTPYYSWRTGSLAKGCRHCVKGEKLVLFITGLCSNRCDFCPVSDKKLYKNVTYANEMQTTNIKEIIKEAKLCSAKGAGITGGDPLIKTQNTCSAIKKLKKEFGKEFHIHLYAPLKLLSSDKLKKLHSAGLDEIRFHPDLEKPSEWNKILLAKEKSFSWDVGVEIPVIPGKEKSILGLIHYIKDKVDFLNLNELELADNAVWRKKQNIKCKDDISYAIKGSDELAKKLLETCANIGLRTHYCTCKLKDKVQLAKRIKRRAQNIKQKFDIVTNEGMIVRGAVYLPELKPGFGYHDKLNKLNNKVNKEEKRKLLNNLESIKKKLIKQEKLPKDMIAIDKEKLRLITSKAIVKNMKTKLLPRAIVTEYPTFDALEMEVEFLN